MDGGGRAKQESRAEGNAWSSCRTHRRSRFTHATSVRFLVVSIYRMLPIKKNPAVVSQCAGEANVTNHRHSPIAITGIK